MRVVLSQFCKQCMACRQGDGQQLPGWAGTEAAAHSLPVSSARCPSRCSAVCSPLCSACAVNLEWGEPRVAPSMAGLVQAASQLLWGTGLTWVLSSVPTGCAVAGRSEGFSCLSL